MQKQFKSSELEIPQEVLDDWQTIVDLLAEIVSVPSGLIMRIVDEDLEVFLASQREDNPYSPGRRDPLIGSGLYCERVIRTREQLKIKNGRTDPQWQDSPDVAMGMISYLGLPLMLPNDEVFGTICILGREENDYSDTIVTLVTKFRDIVQAHLDLAYMNHELGERNRRLSDYLGELQSLRGLIPICGMCKKIKDNQGYWKSVEEYLVNHPDADFSHGYCPDCARKLMEELAAEPG